MNRTTYPTYPIVVPVTVEESEWVKHAAELAGMTLVEYVRHAINALLRQQGVDAVLLTVAPAEWRGRRG